jgi:hypothetical protein
MLWSKHQERLIIASPSSSQQLIPAAACLIRTQIRQIILFLIF